jgi:hypothetical protein
MSASALQEVRMDQQQATRWVRGTIRAAMNRRHLSYADLAERLRAVGIEENERNLRNKVARGVFSAVFFVQCLEAMGMKSLPLDMLEFTGQPPAEPFPPSQAERPVSLTQLAELEALLAEVRRRLGGAGGAS